MRTYFHLFVLVFSLLSLRVVGQEVAVPIDREGKVMVIDRDLEKDLQLFKEYSDFQEARVYQVGDSSFVLEIYYKKDDRIYKERKPLTQQELEDYRSKVSNRIYDKAPSVVRDQEGRTKLLIGSAIVSLGFYGPAVPAILEPGSARVGVGLYMLTAGGGFFLPFKLTQDREVSRGNATSFVYGQTRGAGAGALMGLISRSEQYRDDYVLTWGIAGSVGGAIAGYAWSDKQELTDNRAASIGMYGDFGALAGAGTAITFDMFNDRAIASTVFAGWAGGLVAGHFITKNTDYTRGDAYVSITTGGIGALYPITLLSLVENENPQVYAAGSTLGGLAGLFYGHRRHEDYSYSSSDGLLVGVGAVAGGLIGMGAGYLLFGEFSASQKVLLTGASAGATAGFFILDNIVRNSSSGSNNTAVDFNLNPAGFMGWLNDESYTSARQIPTMVSARIRF